MKEKMETRGPCRSTTQVVLEYTRSDSRIDAGGLPSAATRLLFDADAAAHAWRGRRIDQSRHQSGRRDAKANNLLDRNYGAGSYFVDGIGILSSPRTVLPSATVDF
jgi:hypothetical protein